MEPLDSWCVGPLFLTESEKVDAHSLLRSVPHPFIAILSVLKGKRILPRAVRHLSQEQTLTLLTLIVATFETLDTVRDAPILDASVGDSGIEGKQRRVQVELKTEAFLNAFIAPVMGIVGAAPLRMVTGLMGLLLDRNNVSKVVQSKVCQHSFVLLTILHRSPKSFSIPHCSLELPSSPFFLVVPNL